MSGILNDVDGLQSDDEVCTVDNAVITTRDSVQFIHFCAGQVETAMTEAYQEIDALTQAIVDTATNVALLQSTAAVAVDDAAREAVNSSADAATESVNSLYVRLQFADRLSQRLSNIKLNLGRLASSMFCDQRPVSDATWTQLLEQARATFTMEEEREIFDAEFSGSIFAKSRIAASDVESSLSDDSVIFSHEIIDE